MEGANFENKLKENLSDYSSPIDLDLEWADLETRRNKKRKKRPFFWIWWATGIILLSGSIMVLMTYSKDLKKSATHDPIVEDQPQKEIFSNNKNQNSTKSIQDELSTPTALSSSQKISEETNNVFQKDKSLGNSKNVTSKNIKKTKNQELLELDFSTTKRKVESSPDSSNIKLKVDDLSIASTNRPSLKSSIDQKDTPVLLLPTRLHLVQNYKSLPILKFELNPKKSIEENQKNWALGISTSYGKSFRNLTPLEDNFVSLVDRRNQAEEALDVWQTALVFRKNINDKWFLDLGLGYAQSADRFEDLKMEFSNPIEENQLLSITHLIDGSTIEETGDVIADRVTISDNTFYQYQGNVFIKLAAGRNLIINPKNGFSFSSGFKFNTYTFKQGEVFIENDDAYGNLKDYDLRKIGIINTSSNLEYYRITKNKIRISIGLEGEFQLINTFSNKSDLKEKRNILGLSASIIKPF